jgi:citrate lyase subunit alpha / citrate CoA-transferase
MNLVKNAVGRLVPDEINGVAQTPYLGIGKHRPTGRKYAPIISTAIDYPLDGNKLLPNLREALERCGLKDGMVIGTHHHMRDGDLVAVQIFDIAKEMGVKDLVWVPSASFPCHDPLVKYLEDGTIHHIEGSMNGPLGRATSQGRMKGMGVLRSHGGRYQAIQDGEVHIDIAVIAAPTADPFGNGNGLYGPSACGNLGYALADYQFADKVVVVTDNLIKFPCIPMQVEGNYVDYVVKMEKIGIPEKIVSGTTQITNSPDRLLIAELTAQFCEAAGLIHDGFCFQAGAGGTSLSIGIYFHELLKAKGWKARFEVGGSTQYSVKMLEEGCLEYMLDAQAFDLDAVRSMRDNPNHVDISIFHCYNYHGKGTYTSMMDVMILGATEVDTEFNGNVVTHSDGCLLHGIGGWQNCLFAKCTILPIPLFRDRMPVIMDRVTTLCGPGELVDVIVTERGLAINPRRTDLLDAVKNSGLPIKTIQQLKDEAERICGKPKPAEFDERVVAAIKWVDGTVIDCVRKMR